ncbi:MAG: chromate transporter [Alphaproteobacteria bacterium]|nr:chromate transporter [Alphaproteobacteria bacterium]
MTIFMLMVTFAKFGLLCFGGGYMIIPMLLHTFVEEKAILTLSSYGNLISLSQITPGPVSINAATYVGYLANGVLGGIFASIGLILPGLFLAYFMVRFLQKFKGTFFVNGLLTGMRMAAVAMVLYACLIFVQLSVLSKEIPWKEIYNFLTLKPYTFSGFHLNIFETIICIMSFLIVYYTKFSITALLFVMALVGAFYGVLFLG